MKIATYNVNGINGRLPRLLEWLEESQPDIACLQEIKTSDETFPLDALHDAGYGAIWSGQKSYNGVAILARDATPVERLRTLPGGIDDTHSRYIEAEVDGVIVASLYLPNGNPQPGPKFDYKLAWFERFNQHAKGLLKEARPVVLAGDYNVVPTDFDIYDARAWAFDAVLQPETRAAWQRLLAQGWIDATRALQPHERVYTFWVNDFAFRRNAGFRMDFLLLSPGLRSRLRGTGVDAPHRGRERPSDHAPVWVELA